MKTGRNNPCPCGSKKKYKKCCLASGKYEQKPVVAKVKDDKTKKKEEKKDEKKGEAGKEKQYESKKHTANIEAKKYKKTPKRSILNWTKSIMGKRGM